MDQKCATQGNHVRCVIWTAKGTCKIRRKGLHSCASAMKRAWWTLGPVRKQKEWHIYRVCLKRTRKTK